MKKSKEEQHFISILEENQGIIYKVVNSYCRNETDREDLIQEISIQLWKAWPKYDDHFKISTWMYKIALNVAISFYRKHYQKSDYNQEVFEEKNMNLQEEEEAISDNVATLYEFIDQLNEINKALMLLYLDQYTYEDIALTLGISKTNVATKVGRIKKQLQKKFK